MAVALLKMLMFPESPLHCGVEMDMTSAKLVCRSCGYKTKLEKGETSLRAMDWPTHCDVPMKLSRAFKCANCGHESSEDRQF